MLFCFLLLVIWNHFHSTGSARDAGTLYAMRNAIDARNVSSDPHNPVLCCQQVP